MARAQSIYAALFASVAIAASLFCAAPASAQTWLAPAYPDATLRGAAKAKGAVIWNHGRSVDSEDSEAPTPAYMALLRDGGWDAFRFNRTRADDTLDASTTALVHTVEQLKGQGYRRVALAGQSFGGFLALMAADSSDAVDVVVATAPAAYGNFADYYDSWRSNATRLYPLLRQVRHARVMMFFFHGDDFDPGGRGDRSRQILAARGVPNLIIDQPRQLTTHWAATTPLFTRRFGSCILDFLDMSRAPDDASCDHDALVAGAAPDQASSPRAASQGEARRRPNGG